jgi:uncharacterized protein (DUF2384 family)
MSEASKSPTNIKLSDLFPVHQGGKQIFAQKSGQLVHINDVESGLACECECPGCGRKMVAHKGRKQSHHFQHRAEEFDCVSVGETALHKQAKDILAKSLSLRLPELKGSAPRYSDVVLKASRIIEFDDAFLEKKQSDDSVLKKNESVVPDVICRIGDRFLHVEFKVTHACGPEKIDRLRKLDVGAIEIDLSAYRNEPLENLVDVILYNAPRVWLHNPRIIEAEAKRSELEEQRLAGLDKKARTMLASLPNWEFENSQIGAWEQRATENSLEQLACGAGLSIGFTVSEREWRSFILVEFGLGERPLECSDAFLAIKKFGWVHKDFAFVDKEMVGILLGLSSHGELTPWYAVADFIRYLKESGGLIKKLAREASEIRQRPKRQTEKLRGLVDRILAHVRPAFKEGFSFDKWLLTDLGDGSTPATLINGEENSFDQFYSRLDSLRLILQFNYSDNFEWFGLPVQAEIENQREKIHAATTQRAVDEGFERDYELRVEAEKLIGQEKAERWLAEPNRELNDLCPRAAARQSQAGFERATRLLHKLTEELRQERDSESLRLCSLGQLRNVALDVFGRSDMVDQWMKERSLPKLGGLSPSEYCKDEQTKDDCIEILKASRKPNR